jgi:hypothetical protein
MTAYNTLVDKDALLVAKELEQTLSATSITIERAFQWLEGQLAPGPIMVEPDLAYVYKTVWAFFLAGKRETAARILDWCSIEPFRRAATSFCQKRPPRGSIASHGSCGPPRRSGIHSVTSSGFETGCGNIRMRRAA